MTSCHLLCVLCTIVKLQVGGTARSLKCPSSFSFTDNLSVRPKKTTVVNYIQQNSHIMLCRNHLKMVSNLAKCKIWKTKFMHSNKMLVAGQQKASANHVK